MKAKSIITVGLTMALAAGTLGAAVPQATAATPSGKTIAGYLWHDANANDKLDAGEKRLKGVEVRLYTSSNKLLKTVKTNNLGRFSFTNVPVGSYAYKVRTPAVKPYTHTTVAGPNTKTTAAVYGHFYARVKVTKATKTAWASMGMWSKSTAKPVVKAPTKSAPKAYNLLAPIAPPVDKGYRTVTTQDEIDRIRIHFTKERRAAGLPPLQESVTYNKDAYVLGSQGVNEWKATKISNGKFRYFLQPTFYSTVFADPIIASNIVKDVKDPSFTKMGIAYAASTKTVAIVLY